jgi:hypothetical protein
MNSFVRRTLLALVVLAPFAKAQAQERRVNDPGAFAIEALGASAGSLIGIGAVALTQKCGVEDLGCVIIKVGAGGAVGAVGSVVGSQLAAAYTGSRRSVLGASVGAIIGTGVGLGVHWLLNSGSDRNLGDKVVVPIFVFSQGIFSALGSRALGRERPR